MAKPSLFGYRLVHGLLVVALAIAASALTATPARALEGLEVDATTTYRLEPDEGRVHVQVVATLVNTKPATTSGAYTSTPYLDFFAVPALGRVTNAKATTSGGTSLSVDIKKAKFGLTGVLVDLSPNLVYGSPQTITVVFDLAGQAPRSKSPTRVNAGYASWLLLGAGDPGAIDIVIDVPEEFALTLSQPVQAPTEPRGDRQIYRIDRINNLENAVMLASASNDDALSEAQVSLENIEVTIKAWPGDRRWKTFATRWTERGLPALEELIGLDAPEDELSVVESSLAYSLGYAGFYVPELDTVEVGDLLDEGVVLHELSHVWFNHQLFADRWMSEGFAEEMSNRVLEDLGGKAKDPKPVKSNGAPLNAWPAASALDRRRARATAYAYNASYSVVSDLTDEIGMDGMRKVIAAATARDIPYQGDPEPERLQEARDWRYLLDLLEIVGGSKEAEDLFADHVLTSAQDALLAGRSGAQSALDDLAAAGEGWSPPLEVREEMAGWRFDTALDLVDEARELRTRAGETVTRLDEVGVDVAAHLESEYENATSLSDFSTTLDDFEATTDEVVAAQNRLDEAGPVARLGLIGRDVGLGDATAALEQGELDDVPAALATMSDDLDEAASRGGRILLGLVLIALLAIAVLLLMRRRRRRSRTEAIAEPGDEASALSAEGRASSDTANAPLEDSPLP